MVVDSPFTQFVRTPLGGALVIAASVAVTAATLIWVSRRGHADRWSRVVAGGIGAIFVALLNAILGGAGIWHATAYTLPPAVLGSFLLIIAVLLTWMVVFYRWLRRRPHARVVSAVLLAVVAILTVLGDESGLARGYIAFGHGYTVWMDALVAIAIFIVTVLTYEQVKPRKQ